MGAVRFTHVDLPAARIDELRGVGTSEATASARFRVARVEVNGADGLQVRGVSGFLHGTTALMMLRASLHDVDRARAELSAPRPADASTVTFKRVGTQWWATSNDASGHESHEAIPHGVLSSSGATIGMMRHWARKHLPGYAVFVRSPESDDRTTPVLVHDPRAEGFSVSSPTDLEWMIATYSREAGKIGAYVVMEADEHSCAVRGRVIGTAASPRIIDADGFERSAGFERKGRRIEPPAIGVTSLSIAL